MTILKYYWYYLSGAIINNKYESIYSISPFSKNEEEIVMEGTIKYTKNNCSFIPIQALKSIFYLKIKFLSNVGNTVVEILDRDRNIVYHKKLFAFIGNRLVINISSLKEDKYSIYFSNYKQYSKGYFRIHNNIYKNLLNKDIITNKTYPYPLLTDRKLKAI